jgi:predicted nucleic acid-binding protein
VGYLLDTCLLSEVWRPAPNAGVLEWLEHAIEAELFLSALTIGELRSGIAQLPEGRKKAGLLRGYVRIRGRFEGRVLAIDALVAERWGQLSAEARRSGKHLHVVDGLIAATAWVHGLTLVTRNVSDFGAAPVPLENPWT